MSDTSAIRSYSPKEQAVFTAVLTLAGQGVDIAGLRVQQIADAAGMGKGTLYEYFKSKDEILEGTAAWSVSQELAAVEALTASAASLDDLIADISDYVVSLVTGRAPHYRMLAEMLGGRPHGALCPALSIVQLRLNNALGRAWQLAQDTAPLAADVDEEFFRTSLFDLTLNFASDLFHAAASGTLTPAFEQQRREYLQRSLKKLLYCSLH